MSVDIDAIVNNLKNEIDILKARCVVSDEDMQHMLEIYMIEFCCWYDPDNETHHKIGKQLAPHIKALNDKFKFKR